jgi:hypothetical protein
VATLRLRIPCDVERFNHAVPCQFTAKLLRDALGTDMTRLEPSARHSRLRKLRHHPEARYHMTSSASPLRCSPVDFSWRRSGRVFSMMVAALPFIGVGANGTQLFNTTNRLVPTFGVNWRTFWCGSRHSIRFGVKDSCAVALLVIWILSWRCRFIPAFFEKFCLDHYRRDLLASCPKTLRNL